MNLFIYQPSTYLSYINPPSIMFLYSYLTANQQSMHLFIIYFIYMSQFAIYLCLCIPPLFICVLFVHHICIYTSIYHLFTHHYATYLLSVNHLSICICLWSIAVYLCIYPSIYFHSIMNIHTVNKRKKCLVLNFSSFSLNLKSTLMF